MRLCATVATNGEVGGGGGGGGKGFKLFSSYHINCIKHYYLLNGKFRLMLPTKNQGLSQWFVTVAQKVPIKIQKLLSNLGSNFDFYGTKNFYVHPEGPKRGCNSLQVSVRML